jgi:acyl dehydratase
VGQRRLWMIEAADLSQSEMSEIQPQVSQLYFEDFTPGRVFKHGPRRVSREEMIGFAAEFDPQPMHLDEAAAKDTMMEGLSASGWYACCILMRMSVDAFVGQSASMGAPGVDEARWLKPVRPGDSLRVRGSVLSARASQSKPDRGFVSFFWEVFNDRDERVMTLTCPQMLLRRNAGAPA